MGVGEVGELLRRSSVHIRGSSAAEYASLLIGDVLTGANGRNFESPADLTDAIAGAAGGVLKLRFLRGDRTRAREAVGWPAARASREAA